MIRQGPIPALAHGLYDYLFGLALIAAPLVLGYKHGSAIATSIVLGVLVIFLAATTTSKTSLVNQIPIQAHVVLDYVLVAILIASPFLFGFSGETLPTAVFIGAGVVQMLVTIGTRYLEEDAPGRGEPKRRRGRLGRGPARKGGAAAGPTAGAVPDEEIPEFEPPPKPDA